MPRSTKLSLFPDVNVWIALTFRSHVHYESAKAWFDSLTYQSDLCFCRLTQIGFLRLLTTDAVMGNRVRSQSEAWATYDDWIENGGARFIEEPPAVEALFRSFASSRDAAVKDWADSYIAAFAQASGLQLVTFDRPLGRRVHGSIVLGQI